MMKKSHSENIDVLRDAIERMHNCKAIFLEDVTIIEKFGSKIVWKGVVNTFKIIDHPKAEICYAWSSPIKGSKKRRYYTVLRIPPIDSPEKAVRVSIVHNHKTDKL